MNNYEEVKEVVDIDLKDVKYGLYAPVRVTNQLEDKIDTSYYRQIQSKLISVNHKP